MDDNRYVITYEQFVHVFGVEDRIERIKRLRGHIDHLSLKAAKWIIDNCVGSLGKRTLKVVDADGYENDVTYPISYFEGAACYKGETLLFEMKAGSNLVQLLEGDEGLVYIEDARGQRMAINARLLQNNLEDARERLAAARRELNRCQDEVAKWSGIDARFEKIKNIARDEGVID